jgi:hypothetical protein
MNYLFITSITLEISGDVNHDELNALAFVHLIDINFVNKLPTVSITPEQNDSLR